MSKQPFSKQPTTYAEQIVKLKERGMHFENEEAAKSILTHVNYYRLGAYWLPLEEDHDTHIFKPSTSFEKVVELYEFDRHLRLLILDAIERFEVSFRAQWTYHLAHAYGPHAHLDSSIHRLDWWKGNMKNLTKEVQRADEIFIQHLTEKYKEALPPIWAVSEVMSIGLLSRWYKSLNIFSLKKKMARTYDIDKGILDSWLHHLSVIRNVCAHHARLWNRDFSRISPKAPEKRADKPQGQFVPSDRIYNSLIILLYLLDLISPSHQWRAKLLELIDNNPNVPLEEMGFPADWRKRHIWMLSN